MPPFCPATNYTRGHDCGEAILPPFYLVANIQEVIIISVVKPFCLALNIREIMIIGVVGQFCHSSA